MNEEENVEVPADGPVDGQKVGDGTNAKASRGQPGIHTVHVHRSAHSRVDSKIKPVSGAKSAVSRKALAEQPPQKRRREAKPPIATKELRAALKQMRIAVNIENIEIFKLAAFQVIQSKLGEVAQLLRLVAHEPQPGFNTPSRAVATPPAARPMTLENIDQMVRTMDAQATAPAPAQAAPVKNPCQWCGRPGVYQNSRKMWVCQGHLAMAKEDDGAALMRQRLANLANNNEEVIRVDAGTIQAAMQNGQSE